MIKQLAKLALVTSVAYGSLALAMSEVPPTAGETDLNIMFVYNNKTADEWGGDSGLRTRVNDWVEYSNRIMQNSDLGLRYKVAHIEKRNYPTGKTNDEVLDDLRGNENGFEGLERLRDQKAADFVVFIYDTSDNDACGIGYVTNNKRFAYSQVFSDRFDWGTFRACDDTTLAHEIGHNSGLSHGNLQGSLGLKSYAGGHGKSNGVGGGWSTIMMYPQEVGVFASKRDQFSDPKADCSGSPCGVPAGKSNPADAVRYLKEVTPVISSYR